MMLSVMVSSLISFLPYHVSLRQTTASTRTAALRRKWYVIQEVVFLYSELIFPFNPKDPVLLELPIIITQGSSEKYQLALDDLIYVEACQHRLILHTVQGDVSTRCTFADLTAHLTPGGRFFRNGKGLLINFAHVAVIQPDGKVLLKNGRTVFCSRRRKRETREAFLAYAGTRSRPFS